MKGFYLISLDVHSSSCQSCVASPGGRVLREPAVATTIVRLEVHRHMCMRWRLLKRQRPRIPASRPVTSSTRVAAFV